MVTAWPSAIAGFFTRARLGAAAPLWNKPGGRRATRAGWGFPWPWRSRITCRPSDSDKPSPLSFDDLRRQLLEANVLDRERLAKAESAAQSRGQTLERAIVALNLADEVPVWRCLAKAHGLKFVDPTKFAPQAEALKKVPKEQAEQN